MLPNYSQKPLRRVVGLMSGTSVDGIDAALVEFTGPPAAPRPRLLAFCNLPYPAQVREEIFHLFKPENATVDRLGSMNFLLGELYAEAALAVIHEAGLTAGEVDLVASHGQTIYHSPELLPFAGREVRYTVQVGEGAVIAERTGLPTYADFRVADMAAGGQGAPLVPFTEYLLYREENETILLQNIGGIGNITVLPAGNTGGGVMAFDTGPGNMLIDALVAHYTKGAKAMDEGGRMAAAGRVSAPLLEKLQRDAYYSRPLPKTTGREYFGTQYAAELLAWAADNALAPEDAVATVTRLTAWSIADAYARYILPVQPATRLVVGGGGSYNPTLMGFIRDELRPYKVEVLTQEQTGHSSDAKEAVAFALLGDRAASGLPNALPSVTGAKGAAIMGKLSLPSVTV